MSNVVSAALPLVLDAVSNVVSKDDENEQKISIKSEQHQGAETQTIHINIHCCEFMSPCCKEKQLKSPIVSRTYTAPVRQQMI